MQLVSILSLSNFDLITLVGIVSIMIVTSVLILLTFSFSTGISNHNLTSLDYATQWDSPLSEFHCKRDSVEHEDRERIDGKSYLAWFY